jgi:hypothetical protein
MDEFNSPSPAPPERVAQDDTRADGKQPAATPVNNENSKNNNTSSSNAPPTSPKKTDGRPEWMDDETFQQYQQHMHENDRGASEERAKATSVCCSTIFQLILLCLVVAKLEQDYNALVLDDDTDIDTTDSFNAMWILFPVFLIFGCLLLLCTCCIFERSKPNAATNDVATPLARPNALSSTPAAAAAATIVLQPSSNDNNGAASPLHSEPSTPAVVASQPAPVPAKTLIPSNTIASTAEPSVSDAVVVSDGTKVENDIETGGGMDDLD